MRIEIKQKVEQNSKLDSGCIWVCQKKLDNKIGKKEKHIYIYIYKNKIEYNERKPKVKGIYTYIHIYIQEFYIKNIYIM